MSDGLSALPPRWQTERFSLRPLADGDAPALRDITDDPSITNVIPFLPTPFTTTDAEALIVSAAGDTDRFVGAFHRSDGRLGGVVGVHLRGALELEIGYWIGTAFHGRGYATEAAGATIDVVRRVLPGRRVIAECLPGNAASWRVLQKLGFQPSGQDGTRPGRALLVLPPPKGDGAPGRPSPIP